MIGRRAAAWAVGTLVAWAAVAILGGGITPSTTHRPAPGAGPTSLQLTSSATPVGYWAVTANGGVYNYDAAQMGGTSNETLNQPIVGMAPTPDGRGYWLVAADGGIFTFGDARYFGSTGNIRLNQPIVGMAATPDGGGYWLVAADGGIFTFGDAPFYGSTGNIRLNKPVVGMAATPDGRGYWLVAADGGIFTFGDAPFYGSTGNIRLNKPVVGMASTGDGHGYWMVAADGGIFTFGDAPYYGSTGGQVLNEPMVGMAATPDGRGYFLATADGRIFTFGDATYVGAPDANPDPSPVVAISDTAYGADVITDPPVGATGYDISWPQCGGSYPPAGYPLDLVGVTNGYIGVDDPGGGPYGPNPCFVPEAQWAAGQLQVYQVADPIAGTDGDLATATAGPQDCPVVADTTQCAYNWGYNNTIQAISYVHSQGYHPLEWWLDVETDEGWSSSLASVNAQVIQGMIDAARASGLVPGIYSTSYQWGVIAGNYPFPGVPTWIAGAGNISGGSYSAQAFCSQSWFNFASGSPTLVQYGYAGSGYTGPAVPWDQDYDCG